ncbi:MAG TPA: glycosyltransferase 87 family protein [Streptosporangiaceae bacterium]|nr:glycosyltransferase 87 family protein [Streptosporangiaceae bacterium]
MSGRARPAGLGPQNPLLWPGRQTRLATPAGGDDRSAPVRTRSVIVGAALFALSLALYLAVFQVFPKHPWSMLDLHIYLWGGRFVRHLQDPYVSAYQPHSLRFTYTPMAAGVFALFAAVDLPMVKLLVVAASIASLVGVLWLTWGALGRGRSGARLGATLTMAAVALWLEPVRQTLSFGQVNLVLMLVVVADLCLPDTRWWKGIGVGLAAGFKLTPLIFIPYLLLTRRFRAAAVATATFGVTVLGSFALLPKAAHHYWLEGLFLNPNRLGNVHYVGNQSLYGAVLRLIGSAAAARPYQMLAEVLAGLAGLALAAWASRRRQEMVGILVCALTGLLVSPVSWSHHWVWVAPMLVVLVDFASRRGPVLALSAGWRRACWLGAVALAGVFSGVLWTVPSHGRHPPVQGYAMTGPQQLLGDLYVLAGLAGLGVIAALLAAATRTGQHLTAIAAVRDGEEPLEPGLAAQP